MEQRSKLGAVTVTPWLAVRRSWRTAVPRDHPTGGCQSSRTHPPGRLVGLLYITNTPVDDGPQGRRGLVKLQCSHVYIHYSNRVQRQLGLDSNVLATRLVHLAHLGLIQICRYGSYRVSVFSFWKGTPTEMRCVSGPDCPAGLTLGQLHSAPRWPRLLFGDWEKLTHPLVSAWVTQLCLLRNVALPTLPSASGASSSQQTLVRGPPTSLSALLQIGTQQLRSEPAQVSQQSPLVSLAGTLIPYARKHRSGGHESLRFGGKPRGSLSRNLLSYLTR